MASILPPPESQYFDDNGELLIGGTILTLVPGTSTPKETYQNFAGTILNENPITLDAAARAIILGVGRYRFIVSDSLGNLIYDQETAATLDMSSISSVMLPITSSASLATARSLLGVDSSIAAAIAAVSLITGPRGVTGPQGVTGPTGATGAAGSAASNIQFFASSGTWTKPTNATIAIITLWGAGGAGSDDVSVIGNGAGGGWVSIMVPLSELSSTVAVTIGQGGLFVSGASIGQAGGDTNFDGYLTMRGGTGGSATNPTSGYLSFATGVTCLSGAYDYNLTATNDGYGNLYSAQPFAGTAGQVVGPILPSILGGTGGLFTGTVNGATPGGGGASNSGSGGNGRVIVTCL